MNVVKLRGTVFVLEIKFVFDVVVIVAITIRRACSPVNERVKSNEQAIYLSN